MRKSLNITENNCPEWIIPSEDLGCPNGSIEAWNLTDKNGCALPPRCMASLSNGRNAEIKIMPETASATAIARLGDLGFNVTLKEVEMAMKQEQFMN